MLLPLPRRRPAAAGLRGRRGWGGRRGGGGDAGGRRADGAIGLLGGGLAGWVNVSLELGGFWLGVLGYWGLLSVPLSLQLFGFLQLTEGWETDAGQKTNTDGEEKWLIESSMD